MRRKIELKMDDNGLKHIFEQETLNARKIIWL
jgi:hypothetical protein